MTLTPLRTRCSHCHAPLTIEQIGSFRREDGRWNYICLNPQCPYRYHFLPHDRFVFCAICLGDVVEDHRVGEWTFYRCLDQDCLGSRGNMAGERIPVSDVEWRIQELRAQRAQVAP